MFQSPNSVPESDEWNSLVPNIADNRTDKLRTLSRYLDIGSAQWTPSPELDQCPPFLIPAIEGSIPQSTHGVSKLRGLTGIFDGLCPEIRRIQRNFHF